MLDIIECDRGCDQLLVLKDGQALCHVSRDAVFSIFQDGYRQFRGNEGGAPESQEQYVQRE